MLLSDRVLFLDGEAIIIDKPAGLLSVPGKGREKADCAVARVARAFPHATGPLVVHRLDMDTSGLLLLALNEDTQRALSAQFERREVRKRYAALVDGLVMHAREGTIDLPLRLDPERRPFQVADHWQGRPATTRWRLLAHETDRTRLDLEPLTGRSHQLRVHCATPLDRAGLGHGILGDVLYGSGYTSPDHPGERHPAPRLMLHATELSFTDPRTGGRLHATSAAPF
ncbi:MAG TPA: RNA pseudouridine synthase [Phycisphaerales bacterium]|nr:RNA pseudouridine synthase [Phycisphaerales bacterium]